jgi:mono/diheme cytochrome c family protein
MRIKERKSILINFIILLIVLICHVPFLGYAQPINTDSSKPADVQPATPQAAPAFIVKPMSPESVKAGEKIYFDYCSGCHGKRADGKGPESKNLDPRPQNLRNGPFIKSLTNERLNSSISGGVLGTAMQAYGLMLSEEKRADVINYIRSLSEDYSINIPNSKVHREITSERINDLNFHAPQADKRNIVKGERLYMNNCSSCHGSKADGKGKIAPNLRRKPRNLVVIASFGGVPFVDNFEKSEADKIRYFSAIANGLPGTSMQPWAGVFNDEEIWNIMGYLKFRADQERNRVK